MVSLAFCAFFAWKSWTLDHEAWIDGQTSQSTWGPPLWIPYTLMAAGMSLLCLQFILQIAEALLYTAPGGRLGQAEDRHRRRRQQGHARRARVTPRGPIRWARRSTRG